MAINIHPSVNNGVKAGAKDFKGGTLTCKCASAPVTVTLGANVAFNHACGCSKCWKPQGAMFSVVAVVPRDKLSVWSQTSFKKVRSCDTTIAAPASASSVTTPRMESL